VLRELSLSIRAGELVALLGPNGAGKTTLLRVLTGLHPARCGAVRLCGRAVREMSPSERSRRMAVVPQELITPMSFSVEDIVMMGRTASLSRWRRPSAVDREKVTRAMEYTDTDGLRHRQFDELSGGEKQRAAIALALAQEPEIILLDEPTSHLDLHHRMDIMRLIERMNAEKGLTVLMVSHDLSLAADFFPRLLLVHEGRLVADGAPKDVLCERILSMVYPCPLRIRTDPEDGSILVRPVRYGPGG
jgi:iron complex transport system ATP-binding protein